MSIFKKIWQYRHERFYSKNHFHLLADIILLILMIVLAVCLAVIKLQPAPNLNFLSILINHQPAAPTAVTTSTIDLTVDSLKITPPYLASGDRITISLHIQNIGSAPITDIKITPNLDKGWSAQQLALVSTSSDATIDQETVLLKQLAANQDLTLAFSAGIYGSTDLSGQSIPWHLKITYQEAGQNREETVTLKDLRVLSDLKVLAQAYYNSPQGDQLGSGPIPPIVDLPTNYWIFFSLNNSGNDLKNVVVSAKLPVGVSLTGRKTLSAGEMSYNGTSRRLTWQISSISSAADTSAPRLGFEVQIKPVKNQIGQVLGLLEAGYYQAVDTYCQVTLSGQTAAIDTNLPDDAINKGQGKVTN
jgi:hypothetical protein